jgi:hypothetical protein
LDGNSTNCSHDGPVSDLFVPLTLIGSAALDRLSPDSSVSNEMRERAGFAPAGECVCWGIPFRADAVVVWQDKPLTLEWHQVRAPWLILMHTTDVVRPEINTDGLIASKNGPAALAEPVADYVFLFADGSESRVPIRRQYQVGVMHRGWGLPCFEAVSHRKPAPTRTLSQEPLDGISWGPSQTLVVQPDLLPWTNWLWAWSNPHPDKEIRGMRIEPAAGGLVLFGVTAGRVSTHPLRWEPRRKAILCLGEGESFEPGLSDAGLLKHIQLDLGQVISAHPRPLYPEDAWERTYNHKAPELSRRELLVEYTAHPEAVFHFPAAMKVPVAETAQAYSGRVRPVPAAARRVKLRVVDGASGRPVAVKLHVHGMSGEHLVPVDRNRIPNTFWYEDLSVDYVSPGGHPCTYIPGETAIDLPEGKVFVEISKGFEIEPVRHVIEVRGDTEELVFTLQRVLDWRGKGWVTADTHVHFLSPSSALLEGAAEGVNVVNLLASQWGELMTNVGDFNGRTTHGSRGAGGDGEYLVRVGTENRQHVLGHISLLGYNGPIIAPMTTGGPDESALGDPVESLLTEWARQCRSQGGLVVVPHFPRPRAEHAAAIVSGDVDGIEMTSWENIYGGIDPYSLADWYRYLNNGHFVAAVGGTDKMAATTAVGAVRTYALLPPGREFDYEAWKEAVRAGNTFVTYGPLMEFTVEGKPPGARIAAGSGGATVSIEWRVASVTVPPSRVDLVVNGEVRESRSISGRDESGRWEAKVERSSWLALLVRGHYPDKPEVIAAHSSPVMVEVEGTPFFAAADAITILDQIEGALVFFDTLATRADSAACRRMRLVLTGVYRSLHNRLHQNGCMHEHTPQTAH